MSTEADSIVTNSLADKFSLEKENIIQLSQKKLAFNDIKDGIRSWRVWLLLAYHDIKVRYLRSILGPFWITISMGITVYSMGYLYAHLFHTDMQYYYPYLVASMLTWTLISSL